MKRNEDPEIIRMSIFFYNNGYLPNDASEVDIRLWVARYENFNRRPYRERKNLTLKDVFDQ